MELRRALDGEVVRFGRTGGPDHCARVGADQAGDVFAGDLDRLFRGDVTARVQLLSHTYTIRTATVHAHGYNRCPQSTNGFKSALNKRLGSVEPKA